MKTRSLLFLLLLAPSLAFAQGSLTPPSGPPAPTMKTLDQIEPRSAISAAPFTISQSGSYYLTRNLKVASAATAITINASNVTVDLNGFTISSAVSPATGSGILIGADRHDIIIRNGSISGTVVFNSGAFSGGGFANGISQGNHNTANIHVSAVSVSHVSGNGIDVDDFDGASLIQSCQVDTAGGFGLTASIVRDSSAVKCGGAAIFARNTVTNSFGASQTGLGILGGTVLNCRGQSSAAAAGIYSDGSVENSQGISQNGDGIHAGQTAINCEGDGRGSGTGLFAGFTATNCVGHTGDGIGLDVGNTATGCYADNLSDTKPALRSAGVLSFCTAQNGGTGPAASTCLAIGCISFGGSITATCSKQLGTTP